MEKRRPYYLQLLREALAAKKLKNPSYSLRAFAARLGVDNGALSAVMSGKRSLSLKFGRVLLQKLEASPHDEELFLVSIVQSQSRRRLKRRDPQVRSLIEGARQRQTFVVDQSVYQSISEWYHAAILELTYRPDFKNNPHYVARTLGIDVTTARAALDRLFDLGLLVTQNGRVVKRDHHVDGNNQRATSAALRRKQKQIREKAIEAVDNHPTRGRYMTTVTMCIDPQLLDEAKRRIDEFNDSLCAFLESGERAEVYTMEIGIFSLEDPKQKILMQKEQNEGKQNEKSKDIPLIP